MLELDPKTQSTLIASLRGNDKDNGCCSDSKKITKMLRYIIVNNVGKRKSYMSNYVYRTDIAVKIILTDYLNNKHWVSHTLAAGFMISKYHSDNYIRVYWNSVVNICNAKITKINKVEKQRLDKLVYVNNVIEKYTDIYTRRYV